MLRRLEMLDAVFVTALLIAINSALLDAEELKTLLNALGCGTVGYRIHHPAGLCLVRDVAVEIVAGAMPTALRR